MLTVTIAAASVAVESFADASKTISRYVSSRGMGSSAFYRGSHGAVRFNGQLVATVAYNGRVYCETCKGEIDADPAAMYPCGKGDCKCGNTSHANQLTASHAHP